MNVLKMFALISKMIIFVDIIHIHKGSCGRGSSIIFKRVKGPEMKKFEKQHRLGSYNVIGTVALGVPLGYLGSGWSGVSGPHSVGGPGDPGQTRRLP